MRPPRRVFMVGGASTTFLGRGRPGFRARDTHPTIEDQLHSAIRQALSVTGVPPSAVEKAVVGNFLGERFARQGHLGAIVAAAHPDLEGKPIMRVEAACASGAAAVLNAVEGIAAGADIALAAGVEVEHTVRASEGVANMALAAHVGKQSHLAFALFPWLFARRAKAYKEATGATSGDIARVVTKAYANANLNPLALKQHVHVTLEDVQTLSDHNREFLEDADLRGHIRTLECTEFTDGGSAAILASEEGLRRLDIDMGGCTEIVGIGHTVRALGAETDPVRLHNVHDAAGHAYTSAGVGPADIDLAELHDCFAITELQLYEALGFAEEGDAPGLLRDGVVAIDGRLPVNTGGGLLGFGHPIGATGVRQVVEIWRQATGRCGDYQVTKRPRVALTANLGGDDRTAIVMIHRVP
jgi:acetyl-CoA acyltransferase